MERLDKDVWKIKGWFETKMKNEQKIAFLIIGNILEPSFFFLFQIKIITLDNSLSSMI